jgi:hypothetical protein
MENANLDPGGIDACLKLGGETTLVDRNPTVLIAVANDAETVNMADRVIPGEDFANSGGVEGGKDAGVVAEEIGVPMDTGINGRNALGKGLQLGGGESRAIRVGGDWDIETGSDQAVVDWGDGKDRRGDRLD